MNSETLPACPAHGVRFVVPLDPEDREQHSAIDATHRCAACGALLGADCEAVTAPATKLAHDFEVSRILAHLKAAPCIACGKPPVCWGTAEGNRSIDPMCDECCAHGNEDGWCSAPWDEHMTDLAAELAKAGFRLTDTGEQMYKLLNPEADDA